MPLRETVRYIILSLDNYMTTALNFLPHNTVSTFCNSMG